MSEQPAVLEATQENFPRLVLENSLKGPVLVDFWAGWAGPSMRQRELLLRLAEEYGGRFLLVTVNTDREKGIAREFGVKSLPSCKLFRYGKPVEQVHGMQTESDFRALIERHIVPLADKVQAAALKAWQGGDSASELEAALVAAPERSAIRFKLAAVHLVADDFTAALEQLSELHRRDPDCRNALPRRALLVLLDMLGADDERTRRYCQILFAH